MLSTAPGGTCVSTGMHLRPTTPVPVQHLHAGGIRFVAEMVSVSAVLPRVLATVRRTGIDLDRFVDETHAWDDAPAALTGHTRKLLFRR